MSSERGGATRGASRDLVSLACIGLAVILGFVAAAPDAFAGEDLAFFSGAVVSEAKEPGLPLDQVDLAQQRGAGQENAVPSPSGPSSTAVAIILWDEVAKRNVQTSSSSGGSSSSVTLGSKVGQ